MGEQEPAWDQIKADLARNRRDLRRQVRRTGRRAAPEPVAPIIARRRMFIALGTLAAAWASVLLIDVTLIRAHVWKPTDAGVSTFAGFIVGFLWPAIWYGISTKVHGEVSDGRRLVSARTMTGTRTIDLDNLVSVRRYSVMGRYGGSWDEYRLKDAHGVRLAVDRSPRDTTIDGAIRQAIERAESNPRGTRVKVTRHARTGLDLKPRTRLPQVLRMFWGLWMMIAALGIPAVTSYILALQLSGMSVWHTLNS
jgi:hypothetical protein